MPAEIQFGPRWNALKGWISARHASGAAQAATSATESAARSAAAVAPVAGVKAAASGTTGYLKGFVTGSSAEPDLVGATKAGLGDFIKRGRSHLIDHSKGYRDLGIASGAGLAGLGIYRAGGRKNEHGFSAREQLDSIIEFRGGFIRVDDDPEAIYKEPGPLGHLKRHAGFYAGTPLFPVGNLAGAFIDDLRSDGNLIKTYNSPAIKRPKPKLRISHRMMKQGDTAALVPMSAKQELDTILFGPRPDFRGRYMAKAMGMPWMGAPARAEMGMTSPNTLEMLTSPETKATAEGLRKLRAILKKKGAKDVPGALSSQMQSYSAELDEIRFKSQAERESDAAHEAIYRSEHKQQTRSGMASGAKIGAALGAGMSGLLAAHSGRRLGLKDAALAVLAPVAGGAGSGALIGGLAGRRRDGLTKIEAEGELSRLRPILKSEAEEYYRNRGEYLSGKRLSAREEMDEILFAKKKGKPISKRRCAECGKPMSKCDCDHTYSSQLREITFSQPMTQPSSHLAQKDHRAGRSFKEELVELMDPRPRNALGMFDESEDLGPNPQDIHDTYKAPFMTRPPESALQKVMRSRKRKEEEPAE